MRSELCPCETGSLTTEHLLRACPLHVGQPQALRFWPVEAGSRGEVS